MSDESTDDAWAMTGRTPDDDLLARLAADHREVERLIDELLATGDEDIEMREDLCAGIVVELIAHARAEAEVVYVWLQQGSTTRTDTLRGIREHDEIDLLVQELRYTHGGDPGLEDVVQELRMAVQRHAWDEEHMLLPLAEREFGRRQLARLIPQFNARKSEILADLDLEPPGGPWRRARARCTSPTAATDDERSAAPRRWRRGPGPGRTARGRR